MPLNPLTLRERVQAAYGNAALHPSQEHPFPVGEQFALDLGYPPATVERMPRGAVESFTGVSNVSVFAEISAGSMVLDLGCGSGLDSLIAAERTGEAGLVAGVDFSEPMVRRAHSAGRELGVQNVLFVRGAAERIPLANSSVDHALVNGIFNLNPFRDAIFRELARVVKAGGRVSGAELVFQSSPAVAVGAGEADWFS